MITRNVFFGENLKPEIIEKIKKILGYRWELEKGSGWTEEYYICIGSFDPDNIEMDCYTESHIDVFEEDLRKILDKLEIDYKIAQY